MKIKRQTGTLLGILFCAVILSHCTSKNSSENPTQVILDPNKSENLASATEVINNRCPVWVDPESRLDSVLFSLEGQLVYYYTLPNKGGVSINPGAFTAYLLPGIIENVRTNPDLKMHRDSSVTIVFNYKGKKGEHIVDFKVGPDMYH